MKIAYLILAHKNPNQINRLIERLKHPEAGFFVHIDKNVLSTLFRENLPENVSFIENRENGSWGKLGIVKATLNGMAHIVKGRWDYIVLLSGQDYPIVPAKHIHEFFEKNNGTDFIEHLPLPTKMWENENNGLDRIDRYHFKLKYKRTFPSKTPPTTLVGKLLHKTLQKKFPIPRIFPSYLKPYGGSQWFNITTDTARYILNFVKQHPDYLKFHKYTYIPDEMFFQSIIGSYSKSAVSDCLRYINWNKPNVPLPAILNKDDLDNIMSSGKLFARKFDSSEILDLIDKSF